MSNRASSGTHSAFPTSPLLLPSRASLEHLASSPNGLFAVAGSALDDCFMRLALYLAKGADPRPNPRVGAVIAARGRIVSVGRHERAGAAHAECAALASAGRLARGATLYVTLEPCNHHGRTGPCVDAILSSGIARVVFGCVDPNPTVRGGGSARLLEQGVRVERTALSRHAEALIEDWRRSIAVSS